MPYHLKIRDQSGRIAVPLGFIEGKNDADAWVAAAKVVCARAAVFRAEAQVCVLRDDYTIVEPCRTIGEVVAGRAARPQHVVAVR